MHIMTPKIVMAAEYKLLLISRTLVTELRFRPLVTCGPSLYDDFVWDWTYQQGREYQHLNRGVDISCKVGGGGWWLRD